MMKNKMYWIIGIAVAIVLANALLPQAIVQYVLSGGGRNSRENVTQRAIEKNDPLLCFDVSLMSDSCQGWPCQRIDLCLTDVFKATKNKKACDLMLIHGKGERSLLKKCYEESGQMLDDELWALCYQVDEVIRFGCFNTVADLLESFEACDRLEYPHNRASCYVQLIPKLDYSVDPAVCDSIYNTNDLFNRSNCYAQIATVEGDPTICERLPTKSATKFCIEEMQSIEYKMRQK